MDPETDPGRDMDTTTEAEGGFQLESPPTPQVSLVIQVSAASTASESLNDGASSSSLVQSGNSANAASATPVDATPVEPSMTEILKTSPDLDALKALYNDLGGGGWTQSKGWSRAWTKKPVDCNWVGLEVEKKAEQNRAGTIPKKIGDLTSLRVLVLKNNLVEGPIPAELFQLRNLTCINFERNHFGGEIPAAFGQLVNLQILVLAENAFTSVIPREFGSLVNLEYLHLRNNTLSGDIPAELGNLTNLIELDVEENALTGNIPNIFGRMTKLTAFWCRRNRLGGKIPRSLGELEKLHTIMLGNPRSGQNVSNTFHRDPANERITNYEISSPRDLLKFKSELLGTASKATAASDKKNETKGPKLKAKRSSPAATPTPPSTSVPASVAPAEASETSSVKKAESKRKGDTEAKDDTAARKRGRPRKSESVPEPPSTSDPTMAVDSTPTPLGSTRSATKGSGKKVAERDMVVDSKEEKAERLKTSSDSATTVSAIGAQSMKSNEGGGSSKSSGGGGSSSGSDSKSIILSSELGSAMLSDGVFNEIEVMQFVPGMEKLHVTKVTHLLALKEEDLVKELARQVHMSIFQAPKLVQCTHTALLS